MAFSVGDIRFGRLRAADTVGVQDDFPQISWKLLNAPKGFRQKGYEVEVTERPTPSKSSQPRISFRIDSVDGNSAPWPSQTPLHSRQGMSVRVRVFGEDEKQCTSWSVPAYVEAGLLSRGDWHCQRIASPRGEAKNRTPQPEDLYRKTFSTSAGVISSARLYITAQGLYEAEINGQRVGDYFLAPGWTAYDNRLQYQTYDVTDMLSAGHVNCIGVRVAEGWFCGRIGFEGGRRNIWGPQSTLMAQLEIQFDDGTSETITTDQSWVVTQGPIRLAEIYNGEKYDAAFEIPLWSSVDSQPSGHNWEPVAVLSPLPDSVELTTGFGEAVRRVDVVQPQQKLTTPSGKTVLDFGQNLVGYTRIKNVSGAAGLNVVLSHAEVLEHGELGTRPLRDCQATDEFKLRGSGGTEKWEPRFTFHGFRYVQVDGWPSTSPESGDILKSIEAVVCHTDMEEAGLFSCSNELINRLYSNVRWSMRDNFLSIPTDCPQRDERLGWTGDLALFAFTAVLIYDCAAMLKNWLVDVSYDQKILGGIPPMVTPNILMGEEAGGPFWGKIWPCAIWHDVVVLAPWAVYEEKGDATILASSYESMTTWLSKIPRADAGSRSLWNPTYFQLGDWLDPSASPHEPHKAATDSVLVANAFLIRSLDLVARTAAVLGKTQDSQTYSDWAAAARRDFADEYVSPNGRLSSDSQTAYALAICFSLFPNTTQMNNAGARLSLIVRRNSFQIGTGFAGTPFICEALVLTGHEQVAYSMLLNESCPSWLYPVTMGATTTWERWDSMLPDGTINPGDMTSFNHYAFGAVASFLYERLAGLQRLEPGWKKVRVAPVMGGGITKAEAAHISSYGRVWCKWEIVEESGSAKFKLSVSVPPLTTMEVVMPNSLPGEKAHVLEAGRWEFEVPYIKQHTWPVEKLVIFPGVVS